MTGALARKILGNKKPTLVVKDTVQAIWGDILATRSVTGVLATCKKRLSETAKDPSTQKRLTWSLPTLLDFLSVVKLRRGAWRLSIERRVGVRTTRFARFGER